MPDDDDGTAWTVFLDRAEEWVRSTRETGEASAPPVSPAGAVPAPRRVRLLALVASMQDAERSLAEQRRALATAAARDRAYGVHAAG